MSRPGSYVRMLSGEPGIVTNRRSVDGKVQVLRPTDDRLTWKDAIMVDPRQLTQLGGWSIDWMGPKENHNGKADQN